MTKNIVEELDNLLGSLESFVNDFNYKIYKIRNDLKHKVLVTIPVTDPVDLSSEKMQEILSTQFHMMEFPRISKCKSRLIVAITNAVIKKRKEKGIKNRRSHKSNIYIGDVVCLTEEELRKHNRYNYGRVSEKQIKDILSQYGLSLGMDLTNIWDSKKAIRRDIELFWRVRNITKGIR